MEYIVILGIVLAICAVVFDGGRMSAKIKRLKEKVDNLNYTVRLNQSISYHELRQKNEALDKKQEHHRKGCNGDCHVKYGAACNSHCDTCKNFNCRVKIGRQSNTHCDGCKCPPDGTGGCFHPETLIALANGSWIPICKIIPGMMVRTRMGTAIVLHAIHYITRGSARMTLVPALKPFWITPHHPLIVNDMDAFPVDAFPDSTSTVSVPFVCNLVLHDPDRHTDHTVLVGRDTNIVGYTLGHGYTNPATHPIVGHPYFGNMEAVLADLRLVSADETGLTVYRNPQPVRDPTTGLIAGVREAEQSAAAAASAAASAAAAAAVWGPT